MPFDEGIASIQNDGFCIIPSVFGRNDVAHALRLIRKWHGVVGSTGGYNLPSLAQDPMVWNLQSKEAFFLDMLTDSLVAEHILMNFLNDAWYGAIPRDVPNYILRGYVARSSHAPLPLHIDSLIPYMGDQAICMQYVIVLEDMTPDNGATIVVPGSHQSGRYVDRNKQHTTTLISAKAGDVVIWDSRLWHGARENCSDNSRWALIATFSRWWVKQTFRITDNVPQEIYEQLSLKQKQLLGFCALAYNDEKEGIEMRRGYESLPKSVARLQDVVV